MRPLQEPLQGGLRAS